MFNKFHFFIFSFFHFFILAATAQDTKVADQILLYQRITGGWPKNIDMSLPLSEAEKAQVLADRRWARFYDLEEGKPFFCDRDGIPRRNINDIGPERRNGYQWYNTRPKSIINH